ncbi:MAG: hypothetical protein RBR95_09610 [Ignavibacteriaceae bacterium]|jgi:hypothetical protein|nr:hypothetical protein [Ignavibacteriaceae bacterium]
MSNEYLINLSKTKSVFHKNSAKTPYEEKVKIIIQLQKLSVEMQSRNSKRPEPDKMRCVWQIEDF